MKLVAVAVRDSAVGMYMPPWFVQHPAQAVRLFNDQVNQADSMQGKHPSDFALFHLGSYDQETGVMESLPQPVQLVQAVNLLKAVS